MELFTDQYLRQLRAETPGTENYIHLNNAGAALMPLPVIEAIQKHINLEANIGGYEAATAQSEGAQAFYNEVAALVNASPHQIAYMTSATDAYNKALSAVPLSSGDVIITTNDDYVSNQLAFLELQKRWGIRLIRAASLPQGGVDPDSVEQLIRQHKPKLVAVTHVPTNSGLIQDVVAIGKLCRQYDVWYLVDACQSAGQLPLDVQAIQCDFLSATFRKFLRGPRGAGFLYVSDKALQAGIEPLFVDLQSALWDSADTYQLQPDARRFETWERPYALVLGATACVAYARQVGLSAIAERVKMLSRYCAQQLSQVSGVSMLDQGPDPCGIVTFHVQGANGEALKNSLHLKGVNSSLTRRSSALIAFDREGVDWALRFSPHYYNTVEEIDQAVGGLG